MATADVIMLANTADEQAYDMTVRALVGLRDDNQVSLNIILVESATDPHNDYRGLADKTITPDEPFNYNRFLNFGLSQRSGAQFTALLNNDLIFHQPEWLVRIYDAIIQYGLDSASPRAPGWSCHEELPKQGIVKGYRTSHEFCGWCLVFKSTSLNRLLPLNEEFVFEWQDVDLAKHAAEAEQRHALVLHSEVTHLLNQSHRLIPQERRAEMIDNARNTYTRIHN